MSFTMSAGFGRADRYLGDRRVDALSSADAVLDWRAVEHLPRRRFGQRS